MIECTRCREHKNRNSFTKDSNRKSGTFAWCKVCVREIVEDRHRSYVPSDDPEAIRECNRCAEPYPLTREYFNVNRSRKYGFEYECKFCKRARRNLAYAADPKREHAWAANRRARVRANGEYETILYGVVFERDNGICRLCDIAVDADTKYPHPKSGTIDHIRPIARGGLHLYDNVQLAHALCNWSKGTRYQIVT